MAIARALPKEILLSDLQPSHIAPSEPKGVRYSTFDFTPSNNNFSPTGLLIDRAGQYYRGRFHINATRTQLFYKDERLAIFIDGSNLYATARALGFEMDFRLLRQEFMRRGRLIRAFYYSLLVENEDYTPVRPLADWLQYNGYCVVTKSAKEFTDPSGRRKIKGNMDIELAVDAMEIAARVDHIVLFSGDGDYRPLVESLQRSRQ